MQTKKDIDNLLKSLFDALAGKIIKNDKQIKRVQAEIVEFSLIGGISIEVARFGSR